jgi:tripeptidyl-peptidase-1
VFSPDEKTINAVKKWLTNFGISSSRITRSDNQGWLAFDATTEEAEGLLHTEYHAYEHVPTGTMSPACDRYVQVNSVPNSFTRSCRLINIKLPSYHVPKHIQEHVDYITPGIRLVASTKRGHTKRASSVTPRRLRHGKPQSIKADPPPGFPWSAAGDLSTCDVAIVPACIRALYGIPEVPEYSNSIPRSDNSLGIFEEGDYYAQQDLDLFFTNFTSNIPAGTHPTPAFIDGAQAPVTNLSQAGGESDLDFELAYPLSKYPYNSTFRQIR